MKGSVKLFIASIVVLALSVGFFLGALLNGPCCHMPPPPHDGPEMHRMMPPPDYREDQRHDFKKDGRHDFRHHKKHSFDSDRRHDFREDRRHDFREDRRHDFGDDRRHGFDRKKAHGFHAELDSILQVTAEQKAALKEHRKSMDEAFKNLRTQKMEAEKSLKEALDRGDNAKINEAKKKVLAAHEALLNQRIAGVAALNKILTKEQQEKFHSFRPPMPPREPFGPEGRRHRDDRPMPPPED